MKESITTRLVRTVEQTLAAHGMIAEGEAVLVAVSGGPDSMALLHVLQSLAALKKIRLGIAHLNHGLRPGEAESDEALVHRTASAAGLPYFTEKADVSAVRRTRGLSMEEAAREVRYRFLEKTARANGYSTIALAHHADDNAELVLMNLLRGSGPLGLAGMPPKRLLGTAGPKENEIYLIRPLFEIRRKDILAYLSENSIPSATDKTNFDLRYRRNRVRSELMPLLRRRYNPNIVDTLNRTAQILRSEKEWIDSLLVSEIESPDPSEPAFAPSLSKARICESHHAKARRLVRMAIEKAKGNLRRIGFGHVDAVLALAERPDGIGSLDLPDRIRVTLHPEQIVFTKETAPLRAVRPEQPGKETVFFEHLLGGPGRIFIPEIAMTVRATVLPSDTIPGLRSAGHHVAFFDMETISFPLTVRNPRPGDRFIPLGMTGRQKIKKFFSDHKIPVARRACCPVLESEGRPIWLMGYRMDDTVKITAGTKQVLKVEFSLA